MRIFVLVLIGLLVIPSPLFGTTAKNSQQPQETVEHVVQNVYNRYSLHLDKYGLVYQAPEYGVRDFKKAATPREIMSLAMYYKYRAFGGDAKARRILRNALADADLALEARPLFTQSFEDAAAQFLMTRAIEQIPALLSKTAENLINSHIAKRMRHGINVQDTSNRAALSAVYWQYLVNALYERSIIDTHTKIEMEQLLKKKMKKVMEQDITSTGWYLEGTPMRFNPHYHVVTAVSLMAYAKETNDAEIRALAEKMTERIRMITFQNGMIEAALGERPVGIGAQIYLGSAYLAHKSGFNDSSVFLRYASGDRFFSDPLHSNRLEYHATSGENANFHDDIAFSNMAELVLLDQNFLLDQVEQQEKLVSNRRFYKDGDITVINYGESIWLKDTTFVQNTKGDKTSITERKTQNTETIFLDYNATTGRYMGDSDQDQLDDHEEFLRNTNPRNPDTDHDGAKDGDEVFSGQDPLKNLSTLTPKMRKRYGKTRIPSLWQEKKEADTLREALWQAVPNLDNTLFSADFLLFAKAYTYGRYTVDEILDDIKYRGGTVHPSIPAPLWRGSKDYLKYLERMQ